MIFLRSSLRSRFSLEGWENYTDGGFVLRQAHRDIDTGATTYLTYTLTAKERKTLRRALKRPR